jgi:hypothetical protein
MLAVQYSPPPPDVTVEPDPPPLPLPPPPIASMVMLAPFVTACHVTEEVQNSCTRPPLSEIEGQTVVGDDAAEKPRWPTCHCAARVRGKSRTAKAIVFRIS